ncbi:hypothetical protein [Amycolatopsis suaedae]|uniref:SnoaL-like domain-containing protein n=1 Tax=Amycolatopsis suaedae TaxID=2510978 RepID=A0A4Q7JBQ9_9PSEU|nr:hypothetical protein [Amycolatopsis suaedae]RZQ64727.1 hypothetical protein EWH70_07510 [Amycolatopsis suaedae]
MATQVRIAWGLVLVAVVFAGWAGWSWLSAATDDGLGYAAERDAALAAGREQVAVLNSLDHTRVDADIARWLEASTGPLRERLAGTDAATRQAWRDGGTVSKGTVLDAAVSELDDHAGTARLLASVEITVAKAGAAPSVDRNRFTAKLTRTDAGWKLSALDQVGVGG